MTAPPDDLRERVAEALEKADSGRFLADHYQLADAAIAVMREEIIWTRSLVAAEQRLASDLKARLAKCREALVRLRDCDWVISLPDRMDAVRDIAREALTATQDGAAS